MINRRGSVHILKTVLYALAILSLILARSTQAAEITFHFQGNVTSFDSSLIGPGGFDGTQPLTGSYTFESTTPDVLSGDTTHGWYALSSLTYSVGGLTFTAVAIPGTSDVITVLNQPGADFDRYDVGIQSNLTGPLVNGRTNTVFYFQFEKVGLFPDDTLPLTPPAVAGSSQNMWLADFITPGQGSTFGRIQGEITSLTVAPVPLPGAWLLMGTGLAAFRWMRKSKG